MLYCIAVAVLFRCDDLKRFVIPEHSENDVTDFVHDCTNSNLLFLAGTLTDVVIVNYWIYRQFRSFIHL